MKKRKVEDVIFRGAMLFVPQSKENLLGDYKKALTIKNPKYIQQKRFSHWKVTEPEYLKFYKVTKDYIIVPRNYLKNGFYDVTNEGDVLPAKKHKINLKSYQVDVVEKVLSGRKNGLTDFLLNIDTGLGKTIMAIYLAIQFGRRVLVVVPTRELGQQWISRIKEFSEYTAGFYKENETLFDFNICTYQYLSGAQSKGFDKLKRAEFYKPFGTIIFDEYHRAGAYRFYYITSQATPKYRLLLTATFRRTDKMTKIMQYDFQTRVILKNDKALEVQPVEVDFVNLDLNMFQMFSRRAVPINRISNGKLVKLDNGLVGKFQDGYIFTTDGQLLDGAMFKLYPSSGFSTVLFENFLAENQGILDAIEKEVIELAKEDRAILVLSSRLQMLQTLYDRLSRRFKTAIVVGKNDFLKDFVKQQGFTMEQYTDFYRNEAQIILGIDRIAKEGLDIPRLDTLVLATSYKDIEQAIGRINREYLGKKQPKLVYFVYDVQGYRQMWDGRKGALNMLLEFGAEILPSKKVTIVLNVNK